MGFNVYFDSGTTNSRAYLLHNNELLCAHYKAVGTVDNVLHGDKTRLEQGLKELYDELLAKANVKDSQVGGVYMSGMVTSLNGICEVPYLPTPLNAQDYRRGWFSFTPKLFGREVWLMTGVVALPSDEITVENVEFVNNIRGEESEIFGIMAENPDLFEGRKCAVIMPGSHNHIIYVEGGRITDITSCLGGELYASVSQHTILKASVSEKPDVIDPEYVARGWFMVEKYGFNRALYIARAMTLFTKAGRIAIDSYMEGVVNAGIIKALCANRAYKTLNSVIVAGSPLYHEIFSALLKAAGSDLSCKLVAPEISFALSGFLHLFNQCDAV